MKIRMKYGEKRALVDVNHKDCPKRPCFVMGRYVHRSPAGASGRSSWADSELSCITRDNHGCPLPPKENQKEEKVE